MLPELHAFKVLFYVESVSVVTSGHVTKMAVTPFDPQLPKTPCYTQTLRLYFLQNRSYCPLNANREFRVFWRKIMENIKFLIYVAKLMQTMPKHIFWPIIDYSSLYAAGVTRIVLRQIGGRGHFRSRDKDGGHTIRSAISENPMIYANFTALSFIEPELLPIEVLHCGNREFRVFLRKIVENIKIFRSSRTSDADDAKTHFLVHYRQFQLVCCRSYTHLRCYFTSNRLVWSLPVT